MVETILAAHDSPALRADLESLQAICSDPSVVCRGY